jgi:hypothetical protein
MSIRSKIDIKKPANNIRYNENVDNYDDERLLSLFNKAKNKIDREERLHKRLPFYIFNKNRAKKI